MQVETAGSVSRCGRNPYLAQAWNADTSIGKRIGDACNPVAHQRFCEGFPVQTASIREDNASYILNVWDDFKSNLLAWTSLRKGYHGYDL